ncbi:T9SS type A sorting domain-containing protein [Neolewinella antarctica]|uniref:Secretion system C-terminal sorting domain-containing protein n=1 Tax=Neolewinella antarctica TaxID=442734 RepID=A0ABX0X9S6_9BACT|nr:T9SS type A sorting domain-containing protein [Neolewinella antarctica]NJC26025.1 hypothetical protein [Neolewinella antarctica]
MRLIYLLFCALVAQTTLVAQTLDVSNIPVVGDVWASFLLPGDYERADFSAFAATGAEATFDFRFLGSERAFADGTTYDMIPVDSFVTSRILAPPVAEDFGEDEIIPEFPEGAVITDFNLLDLAFRNLSDEDFEVAVLVPTNEGIISPVGGEGFVEEGEYYDIIGDTTFVALTLPFGLQLNGTLRRERSRTSLNDDGETVTEQIIGRFEVVSTGTLRTSFGDYENAVAMRVFLFDEFESPGFSFSSEGNFLSYYVPGSYLPIVTLSLDEDVNEDGSLRDSIVQVIVNKPVNLSTDVAELERERFQLVTYPNPATERIQVKFQSQATNFTHLNLLSIDGKLVGRQVYGNLAAGEVNLSFTIPSGVINGTYLLQVEQAGKTTARPVVVKR